MILPHKIATLLYCFNEQDEVLLLHRLRPPNEGLWSPPGGKLHVREGESPHQCAAREASEELGLQFTPEDFRLTGLVSEEGYLGQAHWLMFLFELKPRLRAVPRPHGEGHFAFHSREALPALRQPQTDLEQIWPLFWSCRGGFFAAHCQTSAGHPNRWSIYEQVPRP